MYNETVKRYEVFRSHAVPQMHYYQMLEDFEDKTLELYPITLKAMT